MLEDLKSLWETDLEGAVLGAVLDAGDLEEAPRASNYFNAGVILLDLIDGEKRKSLGRRWNP